MIGDKIKKLRNKKKIYQQELADALSVSKSTVAMWETNRREPDIETIKKIAAFFNCSISYLLSDKIKFDFSPHDIEESIIKCPICDYDCVHFIKILSVDFGNDKSDGIAIEFQGECGHKFYYIFETYKGNTFFVQADKHCNEKYNNKIYFESAPINLGELWNNDGSDKFQKKYSTLDEYGKEAIDSILNIEYNRCTESQEDDELQIEISHSNYKVSAGTGFDLDEGDNWETIYVPDTPESREADFAITIEGNSMEPIYFDGDIVLVKKQDTIDVGEIGIYTINGKGYIKKYGGDRLISLNAEYDDIEFADDDCIKCNGKVIGRV